MLLRLSVHLLAEQQGLRLLPPGGRDGHAGDRGPWHDLSVALPRRPLRVERDAVRLTQVVFILLNNAAKYTDPGGKTWLTVEREAQQAVVRPQ